MSKRKHSNGPAGSPGSTLAIMVIGGILVLGLVGWALSRSMAPRPAEPAQETAATFTSAPSATTPDLSATSAPQATASVPHEEHKQSDEIAAVGRVNVDELKAMYDRGQVTVVDVRDFGSFAAGHITGAIHVPMARVEAEIPNLPKGKPIVTYCT